jgi:RHS repeat-associated protein
VISEQVHLPYGTALTAESVSYGTSANPSKKRFTSYERSDATKLDHAVNRHYHAGLGRFTQVDPIEMSAASLSDPQSLNLYAYCGNDPINYNDPDGLFFKKLFRAIGKILRILKIAAMVALTVLAIVTFNIPLLVRMAGEWLYEYGPKWYRKAVDIGRGIAGIISRSRGYGGFRTPGTFPNGTGTGGVSNFLPTQKEKQPPPYGFKTILEAALAILFAIGRLSQAEDREFAGKICQDLATGRYSAAAPIPGSRFKSNPTTKENMDIAPRGMAPIRGERDVNPCPSGSKLVATYHTHGSNNGVVGRYETEGPMDIPLAKALGVDDYILTPTNRVLLVNSKTGSVTRVYPPPKK